MSWFSFYKSTNNKAKKNPKTCEELYKKIAFHADKLAKCNENTTCVDEEISKICSYAHHTPLTDTDKFYINRIRNILDGSALKTSSTELKKKCVDANQRLVVHLTTKLSGKTPEAPLPPIIGINNKQPSYNRLPPTIGNHGGKRKTRTQKRGKTYMKLTCKCTIRKTKKVGKARKTRKQ